MAGRRWLQTVSAPPSLVHLQLTGPSEKALGGVARRFLLSRERQQEGNIRADDNSLPISELSRTLWNQEYLALTFSKSPQPGRKKRSRSSEIQVIVPRHDKRCLKEVQKPAHIWIRHSLRKKFQRPSVYLTIRREVPFRHPYAPKIHSKRIEWKNSKDNKITTLKKGSKKNASPYEATAEFKKTLNDEKIKRGNKTSKSPSKSPHKSELFKKPKYKSETILVSKDLKMDSMKDPKKDNDSRKSKETDTESICSRDNECSKNNANKSETCSKNCSNMDLIIYLEESDARSMDFNAWLNNYSQNNSKKPTKESKKSSDAESIDSKDAKKDKKLTKKDSKKDIRKDTESTDSESVDSKDAKKDSKKSKKDSKKGDKKKKDAGSTETESIDSKGARKDSKKAKKDSKKGDKKNDAKKDVISTDVDSESEWASKKNIKDEKKNKKDDKKKYAVMAQYSSETESDLEFKIRKDLKKDIKNYNAKKSTESTDGSDANSKKDPKKYELINSVEIDTEDALYMLKKIGVDESDASSTDSKKEALESKTKYRLSRKTKFREKEKERKRTGRIPPTRMRPPLPPCEPFLSSPKVKHPCQCKMPPPSPPKPRYAPLPEAKWIHKLL
ncbi:cylicin-1 [Talpa occidentalis]|uniref:cylicin-1 n=1 Tax=Talpa occidentalis TaxID=50954 RepID=UPI00188E01DE|nr:cylicin-1 [Talpa occidentalis]